MSYSSYIINANYAGLISDGYNMYILDASLNSVILILPDCSSNDGLYYVVYCKDLTNSCNILCYGSQSIDNIGTSISFSTQGQKYNFVSYQGIWYNI